MTIMYGSCRQTAAMTMSVIALPDCSVQEKSMLSMMPSL